MANYLPKGRPHHHYANHVSDQPVGGCRHQHVEKCSCGHTIQNYYYYKHSFRYNPQTGESKCVHCGVHQ